MTGVVVSIVLNQFLKSSIERAFGPGKDPISPSLHDCITDSGPETRNIGATIAGNFNCFFIDARISVDIDCSCFSFSFNVLGLKCNNYFDKEKYKKYSYLV